MLAVGYKNGGWHSNKQKLKNSKDLVKLYNRYSTPAEFLKNVDDRAQRFGIPKIIPNPNPEVKPYLARGFRDTPEGMMPNPKYFELRKQMSKVRERLGDYIDKLEKNRLLPD